MASSSKQQSNSSASRRKLRPTKRSDSSSLRTSKKSSSSKREKVSSTQKKRSLAGKQKSIASQKASLKKAAPKAQLQTAAEKAAPQKASAKRGGNVRAQAARAARATQALPLWQRLPRIAGICLGAIAAILLTLFILAQTPLFTITSIETDGSEHITAEEVARLASLPEGTTLLSVDTAQIKENVMRNPWVASVHISRNFPDKLSIDIQEREIGYVVVISGSGVCWYLGSDGVWIEPVATSEVEGQSTTEAAQEIATELGCILISDAPSDTEPVAGEAVDDEVVSAVLDYMNSLPEELSSQITQFTASSEASLTCALSNGVTILLGEATSISSKATVILTLLEEYADQITYINVRTPSNPSFRRVDSENVQSSSNES